LKKLFRNIIRPLLYWLGYMPMKKKINITRSGMPLKKGITAVVAMKNESYTLPFCLESLIGFADQIVIVDNGSEDDSLQKARAFKAQHEGKLEIDIIEMPHGLLGDCREAGLQHTRYQWHLRWDADMVAKTSGINDIRQLRYKILQDDTPRSIQLPRINIFGDLLHVHKAINVLDPGEPILVWFSKHVCYREYGKFDTIRIPYYYKQQQEDKYYYFHCSGLKSDDNLIHRFHYFTWREQVNKYPKGNIPPSVRDFHIFKQKRNQYLFGTNDIRSIKFRYQRQLVSQFEKYNTEKFGEYPEILAREINNEQQRFRVIYKDNQPYLRIDMQDESMKDYVPTEADLNWNIDEFLHKLLHEDFKYLNAP
jgi:glycosyltransferase involved in cell wall biosynthesis